MLNICTFEGCLTKDPEARRTKSGLTICNAVIAVDKTRKTGDPEKDRPLFLSVTFFGAQAENVAKYFHRGRPIIVTGTLVCDLVDDKNRPGEKREYWYLNANSFDFPANVKQNEDGQTLSEPKPAPKPRRESPLDDSDVVTDDLPF